MIYKTLHKKTKDRATRTPLKPGCMMKTLHFNVNFNNDSNSSSFSYRYKRNLPIEKKKFFIFKSVNIDIK